ncbi:MAG TPA: phytochelatin synthase family protein [Polyangiales bacterium]
MTNTLYRRPLPEDLIAFSSTRGRAVFREALALGGLDGYFQLAEQFHTQADPAFCGLGSLVVALNALGVDPGRLWKGPWRWFAEELLDCCIPLERVRERGMNLDELACLARCNGAQVQLQRAESSDVDALRAALAQAARGESVVIAAYDRASLGQTGSGHFSPLGGFHAERDLALILDVARFKYPPHWASTLALWRAMGPIDPDTGRSRGWLVLRASPGAAGLGFSLRCAEDSLAGLSDRLRALRTSNAQQLTALVDAARPLAHLVERREPTTPLHAERLARARTALQALALYAEVRPLIDRPEEATLILLAIAPDLAPTQRTWLRAEAAQDEALRDELDHLRAQLEALTTYAS